MKLMLDEMAVSVIDWRVFTNSSIYEKAHNGTILPSDIIWTIGETTISLYIIAGKVYRWFTWLMKPFPNRTQDQEKKPTIIQCPVLELLSKMPFGVLKE